MGLTWTGERFSPGVEPEVAYEHYVRYLFARHFCQGKSVVDIPSGEGFGTAMLAEVAANIIGLDVASEAVEHARKTYGRPNLRFDVADMASFGRELVSPVDVIVCFQGIEHAKAQEQVAIINAMADALNDEGILLISTPNKPIYPDLFQSSNQFHEHQLNVEDFIRLLKLRFPYLTLFGQSVVDAALITPLTTEMTRVRQNFIEFDAGKEALRAGIDAADRFTFLVAVCSKRPPADRPLMEGAAVFDISRRSMHMHRALVAKEVEPLRMLAAQVADVNSQSELLRRENSSLSRQLAAQEEKGTVLANENALLILQTMQLRAQYDELGSEVESLRVQYHRKISLVGREFVNLVVRVPLAKQLARSVALPIAKGVWSVMKRRRARTSSQQQISSQGTAQMAITAEPPTRERALHQMLQNFAASDPAVWAERDQWYSQDDPEVSIVILNLNKADLTIRCVKEVWKHTTTRTYEIIVVDNGSQPDEFVKLMRFQGKLRVIRLSRNRYFGEGNNIGAEAARGKYLFFLNNDAFVTPRWLEAFMRVFEEHKRAGAVGAKFVYPDGVLQEAGSLINADGTVAMLGRFGDADDPQFNVRREVDYCPAAGLMLRKDLFEAVLGFDLCWEPAYYEDVDLCMKIKRLGYSVFYCPDATIIHIEHFTSLDASHNVDFGNVVEINRQKFVARWQDSLRDRETISLGMPIKAEAQR